MDFTVKLVFYAVIICFYSRRVPQYTDVKYLLSKITYIPQHASGVYQWYSPFFCQVWLQECFKAQQAASVACSNSSSGLPLANDLHREEWWDNNPTVPITLQCWCLLIFVSLMFLALITFLCHTTSRKNNTHIFFLPRISGIFLSKL